MSDPFEALHMPVEPVAPDREFADRLRTRIERALSLPKGVTVSNLDLERDLDPDLGFEVSEDSVPALAAAVGSAQITPYLAVAGASEAISWYSAAFGAHLRSDPIMMPDGRVGHAELEIGGALIMLADEFPEIGHSAPTSGGTAVTLHLSVSDVDTVIDSAVAAGARLDRAAADFEYGRHGAITDPFGHRWQIMQEPAGPDPADSAAAAGDRAFHQGDIGYVSWWVPSVTRADRFFSSVLGWRYEPAGGPQGRRVEGLALHHGIWGGRDRSNLFCCFAVVDVSEAAQRVRAAGGIAGAPHVEPYGVISDCTDDQGVEFALFQPHDGVEAGARSGVPETADGEVAYVTMEVRDSAKARAFYGAVLGWGFTPGNVSDGWQVNAVSPMVGISGGHSVATTLPMYRVGDIATVVDLVRAAGGTAGELETHPYGITAQCTDDQGTRFYLGQL